MIVDVSKDNLAFFSALASEARLGIIAELAEGERNIKELAAALKLSSAIVTRHVRQLEQAGLIRTQMVGRGGSIQKLCALSGMEYRLRLPERPSEARSHYEVSIPIGQFTDCHIRPTCGIASEHGFIGYFDDPRCFLDPQRVEAQVLWFGQGFIEYKFANFLSARQEALEIEISAEIGSEAPGWNDDWPSDISFYLNGVRLCQWTSPGDFGGRRGALTPEWWEVNQYGMLKSIRINREGTFLDGQCLSPLTINEIDLSGESCTLRFEVPADAVNVGGLTLYGEKFGNYPQNIVVRTYYRPVGPADETVKRNSLGVM